jgi:hypothetical protein
MNQYDIELQLPYNIDNFKDEDDFEEEDEYEEYINKKEHELCEDIKKIAEKYKSKFTDYLMSSVKDYNFRAVPGILEINKINSLDKKFSSGSIDVSYNYSVYNGCADFNHYERLNETWDFELDGDMIIFNLMLPEERYDEI